MCECKYRLIDGPVAELYDLAVIRGFVCPMAISPGSAEAAALITHADWPRP